VPVVDRHGAPLTPCSPAKAEENLLLGLADMVDGTLKLRYAPMAYRSVFRAVVRRDRFQCAWCGTPGSTVDHLVPVSRGGQSRLDNCVVACRSCNHSRNNRLPSAFAHATGMTPVHELLRWFLQHEARLVREAEQALMMRPVSHCRSKEEAAVWAQAHRGQALAAPPALDEPLVTRLKTDVRVNHELYLP
jgi:hypothetical protein